jgi:hypothetical protein
LNRIISQAALQGTSMNIFKPKTKSQKTHLEIDGLSTQSQDSPQLVAFLAEVASLHKRAEYRNSGSLNEIVELLQYAVNCARNTASDEETERIAAARTILQRAETVYYRDVQTKNRLVYMLGLGLGVCAVVLLPILILWIIDVLGGALSGSSGDSFWAQLSEGLTWITEVAPPKTVAPLFFFAGIGASASVLSRLTSIDLKDEPMKKMVLVTGASRPALAVIFASVVFVILSNNIVSIRLTSGSEAAAASLPLVLIAAFMCGYSERFASDLIAQIPFGVQESSRQAPR